MNESAGQTMEGIRRREQTTTSRTRGLVQLASANQGEEAACLDLIHVTSVGWGRRIIADAKLEARWCKVFDKDLLYFFVARPAYRFADGGEKSGQMNRFPFVFVLSPENLPVPFHVYPFDTGAAFGGRFGKVPDPTLFLEDYELSPALNAATAHIAWAFNNANAYYVGTLRSGLAMSLPTWDSVGRGWIDIAELASNRRERPDARASAIEVAYARSVDLKQNHVRLVIVPQQLLEDPSGGGKNEELLRELDQLEIKRKVYDWRANETPDSFMDEISSIVRRHLHEDGQL